MIRLIDVYSFGDDRFVAFLYRMLAERKVSESISHKRMPSFEDHTSFVRSKPYAGWYIIRDEQDNLGTCYITKYREVGIWLMPNAKGKGAGKEAMRHLLAMHPGRVFTNTSIHNDGAFAFYSKLGFRHCANMLEHDNDGIARSSDNSGKVEQSKIAEKGSAADRWVAGLSMDVTSGEDCQER